MAKQTRIESVRITKPTTAKIKPPERRKDSVISPRNKPEVSAPAVRVAPKRPLILAPDAIVEPPNPVNPPKASKPRPVISPRNKPGPGSVAEDEGFTEPAPRSPPPMTRVGRITVRPIEPEEDDSEPTPTKIKIEGIDEDERPYRRVKRAPRPKDDEDEQPKPDPKPQTRVAALSKRTETRPPISEETEDVQGARFVRMLNRDRRVVGVTAGFVAERMMEGYSFIEGEPTIPTRQGPQDRVPGMAKVRPRDYPRPLHMFEALDIWRLSMLDDMDNIEKLIDPRRLVGRDCDALIRRLGGIIENPALLGHVYGEPPKGDIAKSLGFGG